MVVGEEGADLGLEVGDLSSELLNAAGEQMQCVSGGCGAVGGRRHSQLSAVLDELVGGEASQLVSQLRIGRHQDGFELVDGLGTGLGR